MSFDETPSFSKMNVAQMFLVLDHSIMIHCDPKHIDVLCPVQYKSQERLTLQFGNNMQIPILDLDVNPVGISGTLSFKGHAFYCFVPWDAVFAVYSANDNKGMIWEEFMPDSVYHEYVRLNSKQTSKLSKLDDHQKDNVISLTPRVSNKKPHLTLVKDDANISSTKKFKKPLPSYLKVIK